MLYVYHTKALPINPVITYELYFLKMIFPKLPVYNLIISIFDAIIYWSNMPDEYCNKG
jgi:hypothetical protein